jgi:hypothetical protein
MQAAPHPRPVRVIVEIDPGQVSSLLAQLVHQFTAPTDSAGALPGRSQGQAPRPPPDPDDEDDDEPAPAQHPVSGTGQALSPPVARGQPAPDPVALPPGTMLGELCRRKHRYEGRRKSLRRQSNGKCLMCLQQHERARKPARPVPPTPVLRETQGPKRPELPPHLAMNAFLSPIVCGQPHHRYRGLEAWTLRYLDSEDCVMCTTTQSQLALAGD